MMHDLSLGHCDLGNGGMVDAGIRHPARDVGDGVGSLSRKAAMSEVLVFDERDAGKCP